MFVFSEEDEEKEEAQSPDLPDTTEEEPAVDDTDAVKAASEAESAGLIPISYQC